MTQEFRSKFKDGFCSTLISSFIYFSTNSSAAFQMNSILSFASSLKSISWCSQIISNKKTKNIFFLFPIKYIFNLFHDSSCIKFFSSSFYSLLFTFLSIFLYFLTRSLRYFLVNSSGFNFSNFTLSCFINSFFLLTFFTFFLILLAVL